MKTCVISAKKMVLTILALAGAIHAQCQTGRISVVPDCPFCDTSIIRGWNEEWSLLYSKSSTCGNQFHLVSMAGTILLSVQTQCNVKDMEIIEDTAYFCGTDSAGVPVAGHFNINDIFSGTLQENLILLGNLPPCSTVPRRLEAFHVADGVHIVLVEDAFFPSGSVMRVLADVFKTYTSSAWLIEVGYYTLFEESDYFFCDDVAVTEKYVFASGHKRYSSGIYMRKFVKPTTAFLSPGTLYSIFQSPIGNDIHFYPNNLVPNPYFNVVGDTYGEHYVYCAHTTGDDVVIACLSINADTFGITVKDIHVPSMFLQSDVFLSYSSSTLNYDWDVRDVRYDEVNKVVLVLHDKNISIGPLKSVVTVLDYPAFLNRFSMYPVNNLYQSSIDCYPHNGAEMISCGKNDSGSHEFAFGMNDWGISLCYDRFEMPIMKSHEVIDRFSVPLNFRNNQMFLNTSFDKQLDLAIDVLCED